MSLQERTPGHSFTSFIRGLDPMLRENALYGVAADVMAEVSKSAANSRIAPG